MKIVLDTNALLVSLPKKSEFRPIFDSILSGKTTLYISNEILSEYAEIIERKTTASIANNVIELLLNLRNVEKTEIYTRWRLLTKDYDDNKFVDCAVNAGVDFLITNDKGFNVLKNIGFPPITIIRVQEFLKLI
jgi:uncharacterized protein